MYLDLYCGLERGSGCTCFAWVIWGPSVAVDGSQVIDLLSWAHTCLWEQEDSLLSYPRFRLLPDRLIGGRDRWRSKHHSKAAPYVRGLRVQVWMGTWTPRQEWSGLVLFVPGVQERHVFRGTQLAYIGSRITVVINGPTWLWSSTVVRIGTWKMVK